MAKKVLDQMSHPRGGLKTRGFPSFSSVSTSNGSIASKLEPPATADLRTSSSGRPSESHLRQRRQSPPPPPKDSAQKQDAKRMETSPIKPRRRSWLLLALLSGAFAAFNGAFAKLTTTSLTSSLTHFLASILSLPTDPSNMQYRILDIVIRGLFFGLNLISNGIMWALFTRALTAHSSATQVSILNTSANFMVTAVLGVGIFSERLGGLWFVGAAFLVLGNVIIGRKAVEESKEGEREVIALDGADLVEEGGEEREDNEWDALLEVDEDEARRGEVRSE